MTTKTIGCIDCGEAVPYGRLSCPACGALLASVTGGRAKAARTADVPALATEKPDEPVPSSVAVATAEPDAAPRADGAPDTAAEDDRMAAAVAVGAVATHAVAAASRLVTMATRRLSEPEPSDEPATPWAPLDAPVPMLTGRPYQRHVALEPDPATWNAALASAYRPSTLTLSSAAAFGPGSSSGTSASVAQPAGLVEAMGIDAVARASRLLVIDAAKLIEVSGWFVVVGAVMSMLGFLLPWSATVIGASGIGGYFDSWGMASPTHAFIVLGLLAVLALGILPTPVAAWLRTGVLGIAVGSLIIGVAWPYLVGRLGADVGVTVTALGGLALVIGGVVASWATRHAEPDPSV